jgi:choice-of-anchor C domain-containing protein
MARRARRGALAAALAAGALAVAASVAYAANLAGDGGFESPVVAGGFQTFPAGSTLGGAWHVDSGSADVVHTSLAPFKGKQSLDLDGNAPGAISQVVSTSAGKDYKIAFKLAGNPLCAPVVKTVSVRWNGSEVGQFTFDTTGKTAQNMGYVGKKAIGHATSSSSTLQFASLDASSSCGPELDAVKVTLVK